MLLFARTRRTPSGYMERLERRYFKHAVHEYVVKGDRAAVSPHQTGTGCGSLRATVPEVLASVRPGSLMPFCRPLWAG